MCRRNYLRNGVKRDPVKNFEEYLVSEGTMTPLTIQATRDEFKAHIENEVQAGFNARPIQVSTPK